MLTRIQKRRLIQDIDKICAMSEKVAVEKIKELIYQVINLDFSSRMTTPLSLAIDHNKPKIVKLLLAHGAKLNTHIVDDDNDLMTRNMGNDVLSKSMNKDIDSVVTKILLKHAGMNGNYQVPSYIPRENNFQAKWLKILKEYKIKIEPASDLSSISAVLLNYDQDCKQYIEEYILEHSHLQDKLKEKIKYLINPLLIKEAKGINCANTFFADFKYNFENSIDDFTFILENNIFSFSAMKNINFKKYHEIFNYLLPHIPENKAMELLKIHGRNSFSRNKKEDENLNEVFKAYIESLYLSFNKENPEYKKIKL